MRRVPRRGPLTGASFTSSSRRGSSHRRSFGIGALPKLTCACMLTHVAPDKGAKDCAWLRHALLFDFLAGELGRSLAIHSHDSSSWISRRSSLRLHCASSSRRIHDARGTRTGRSSCRHLSCRPPGPHELASTLARLSRLLRLAVRCCRTRRIQRIGWRARRRDGSRCRAWLTQCRRTAIAPATLRIGRTHSDVRLAHPRRRHCQWRANPSHASRFQYNRATSRSSACVSLAFDVPRGYDRRNG
jgi:hypothetical protein